MKRSHTELVQDEVSVHAESTPKKVVDNTTIQRELQALAFYNNSSCMTIAEVIEFSNLNLEGIPVASSVILTNISRSCGKYTLDGMFASCNEVLELPHTILELQFYKFKSVSRTKAQINEHTLISSLFEAFDVIFNGTADHTDPDEQFVQNYDHSYGSEGQKENFHRRDRLMINTDKPEVLQKKVRHLFGKVVQEKLVRTVLEVLKKLLAFEYRRPSDRWEGTVGVHVSQLIACVPPATLQKRSIQDVTPQELVPVLHLLYTVAGSNAMTNREWVPFQDSVLLPFIYANPPLAKWLF